MQTEEELLALKKEVETLRREKRRLERKFSAEQEVRRRAQAFADAKDRVERLLHEEWKKQEQYLQLLLQNSADIIFLLTRDLRVIYCSDSFLKAIHLPGMGLVEGRPLAELFSDYCAAREDGPGWDFLQRGELVKAEFNASIDMGRSGIFRSYQISCTPLIGREGEGEGAVVQMHDVTDLLEAKEQAEQASIAKGNFLANMSHEMRTPMNAIIGMSAIAKKSGGDPDKINQCLDQISMSSGHLLGVINDILDMSKIEADKLEISEAPFDFERMLCNDIQLIILRAQEKSQRLLVRLEADVPRYLVGDEGRISQVVTNLLSNATKFTPEGGTITVSAAMEEGQVCICVKDNGIGISEAQQAKLFRSFVQADASTFRRYGGTGLGLVISKRLVEMMGGDISLRSREGQGAEFLVRLPLSACDPKLVENGGDTQLPGLRVLLLEESPDELYCTRISLERLDLQCSATNSFAQALRWILEEKRPFDLLFLSWGRNNEEGYAMLQTLKEQGAQIPVVLVCNAIAMEDAERLLDLGIVQRTLRKPLFPLTVTECIQDVFSRKDNLRQEEQVPDLTGRTLLLAEDIEINRLIMEELLAPTGVEIVVAENGRIALERFCAEPERFGIILMDIQMPDMDGLAATRAIRASGAARATEIPIIAMTANAFQEDARASMEAGMNGHLTKPVEVDKLMAVLQTHLLG